eukprot:gene3982-4983_t
MLKSINFVLRNSSKVVLNNNYNNLVVKSSSSSFLRNNGGLLSNIKLYTTATAEIKVPINLIQELRKKTQAPMTDCKKALQASENNMDKAIEWLLVKGKSTADKLKSRVSAEGVISVLVDKNKGVLLELNSETDFVSKGEGFRDLAKNITKSALNSGILNKGVMGELSIEKLNQLVVPVEENNEKIDVSVSDALVRSIAKLRENIVLRRAISIESENPNAVVAGYAHSEERLVGRLGTLVEVEYDGTCNDRAALIDFANKLAVHITAVSPKVVSAQDIPSELLEECKKNEKSPESLYDDLVLLEQPYLYSQSSELVKDFISNLSQQLGTNSIRVKSFQSFKVGDTVEKAESNYLSEVMEKLNSSK